MTTLFIPYRTGRLLILADLHHEEGLDPFAMFGLDGLDWGSLDAVIVAGDIADDPIKNRPIHFKGPHFHLAGQPRLRRHVSRGR